MMFLPVLSKLTRFLSFYNEYSVITVDIIEGKHLCSFSGAFSLPLGSDRVPICLTRLWEPSSLLVGAQIAVVGGLNRAKDQNRAIREGFLEAEGMELTWKGDKVGT